MASQSDDSDPTPDVVAQTERSVQNKVKSLSKGSGVAKLIMAQSYDPDTLDILAQMECLKLKKKSKPLLGGLRDIEPLRQLINGARPRKSKFTYTKTVICQVSTIRCQNGEVRSTDIVGGLTNFFDIGAVVVTSNEAVFTLRNIPRVESGYLMTLNERVCVFPNRRFVICQDGLIGEGRFIKPDSDSNPTLVEKLMEDFELIPRNLAVQIRNEIQAKEVELGGAQPSSSHLDDVD
ncbi:unnamed protein product [Cylicocyclus nassatus]|uniref:Uncharacterized protein n=1 Tax=Cylicocyclus nassatus TaxID=53992 RepID=A0AA36M4Z9_CYLNA|nr:unnamed protein product [Cylicocyclus nassatus]